jgi:TonB family protein
MSARRLLAALVTAASGAAAAQAPAPSTAPVGDGGAVAIERPPPAYPAAAAKKGVDGCVVMSFMIGAQGHPEQVEVVDAKPKGVFEKAAVKSLKQWRYEQPPRPGRYAQAIQFQIKDRPTPVNTCVPVPGFAALNPDAPPLTREVRVLQRVMPAFHASGDAADGGCVTVRFQVRHDGFVGEVQVLDARPKWLAEPAVAAMKQWVFSSFPPPDLYATQTFNYTPELVRMPDNAMRASYATLSEDGTLSSAGCGAPVTKP